MFSEARNMLWASCKCATYLQTERAFTPPMLAHMGRGDEPDIRNITNPRTTSFNSQSWAAVVEEVSAHPLGGLRFSSFRWVLIKQPICLMSCCIPSVSPLHMQLELHLAEKLDGCEAVCSCFPMNLSFHAHALWCHAWH